MYLVDVATGLRSNYVCMYVCITPVCKRGVFTGFGVIITTYLLMKTRTKKKKRKAPRISSCERSNWFIVLRSNRGPYAPDLGHKGARPKSLKVSKPDQGIIGSLYVPAGAPEFFNRRKGGLIWGRRGLTMYVEWSIGISTIHEMLTSISLVSCTYDA